MTHSKHRRQTHNHSPHEEGSPRRRPLHKDWRTWLVVGLMLAAMSMYVLSLDESVQPGKPGGSSSLAVTSDRA